MNDSAEEPSPALPEWVEQLMSDERAYWRTLRAGRAASEAELWESCKKQWGVME